MFLKRVCAGEFEPSDILLAILTSERGKEPGLIIKNLHQSYVIPNVIAGANQSIILTIYLLMYLLRCISLYGGL